MADCSISKALVLISTIAICINHFQTVSAAGCPNGWLSHANSCYVMVSNPKQSWATSASHCMALGAKLVTIESRDEDDFLRTSLLNLTHGQTQDVYYWIGGTDIATEDNWVWGLQETPITEYTNWCPGEPDNLNEQDCLVLMGNCGFKWDDGGCDYKKGFICERNSQEYIQSVIG